MDATITMRRADDPDSPVIDIFEASTALGALGMMNAAVGSHWLEFVAEGPGAEEAAECMAATFEGRRPTVKEACASAQKVTEEGLWK
jgi:hypothetical protein